jgi:hypothetical protein
VRLGAGGENFFALAGSERSLVVLLLDEQIVINRHFVWSFLLVLAG